MAWRSEKGAIFFVADSGYQIRFTLPPTSELKELNTQKVRLVENLTD